MKPDILRCDDIDPDPDQPRRGMDAEELKSLALSVREHGLLQWVIVWKNGDRFMLVDGHRRFAAVKAIGRDTIEALVLDERPEEQRLSLVQLAANCHRQDLKPMDKARAFRQLQQSQGWSQAELARAMHVSKATVTQVLSYLNLPPELQQQLDSGSLAGSTAYAIARAPDDTTKMQLASQALSGSLHRDEATQRVSRRTASVPRVRVTIRMPDGDITIAAANKPGIAASCLCSGTCRANAAAAERQGLDVTTFERILTDRHRARRLIHRPAHREPASGQSLPVPHHETQKGSSP
ncbi:MAG: ParB/RepB/Spo0J family partition protein [Planctomycetaceae bacterium]